MVAGDEELGVARLACAAMGTRFEFLLHGGERGLGWRDLIAAGEAAQDEVLLWHRRLSAFESSSVLSHIHRSGGEWCYVDAETFGLLVLCREMWEVTEGAFDPTVGRLMQAWGLRGESFDGEEVEAARALTGMGLVELDEARRGVRLRVEGVRLDLGAIGKGWALDRAAEVLAEAGVNSALLHAGTSSVKGIGRGPEGARWRVAVGSWVDAPVVEVRDCALGVSAPHGRRGETPSGSVGHVIDPVTHVPVDLGADGRGACHDGKVVCAAAVARSAAVADALSTALLVRPALLNAVAVAALGTGEKPCATAAMFAKRAGADVHWNVRELSESVTRTNTKRECVHV
jgi:thiamine biosynthesis lipoprotein